MQMTGDKRVGRTGILTGNLWDMDRLIIGILTGMLWDMARQTFGHG
jgi:hypothetical protein